MIGPEISSTSERGAVRPARILVADDDEWVRYSIASALQQEGRDVIQAVDGRDALEKLDASQLDAVIADVKMPRMDGRDLLLIASARHPDLPIILITGHETWLKDKAEVRLAFAVFYKPFDLELLNQAVTHALQ